jgi:hypothetical protein
MTLSNAPRTPQDRNVMRRSEAKAAISHDSASLSSTQSTSVHSLGHARYPKSELTMVLDGDLTTNDLARATDAFARLLNALVVEEAPGVRLEWIMSELRSDSSITAQCRPVGGANANDAKWVFRVIAGGQRFADQLERNATDVKRSPELCAIADSFKHLVNGHLIRVRLESPDRDYVIAEHSRRGVNRVESGAISFGSVQGRVQASSSHGSPRFTLYNSRDEKGISCYLPEQTDPERLMLGFWGTMVEVEGFIRHDPETDEPVTIRDIAISAHKPLSTKKRSLLPPLEEDRQSEDQSSVDAVRHGLEDVEVRAPASNAAAW